MGTDESDMIEPYRKIKERDVEITFSSCTTSTSTTNGDTTINKFLVQGKGNNDFGAFSIEGCYEIEQKDNGSSTNKDSSESFPLSCNKRYGVAQSSTMKKKRRRGQAYDSDAEYDFGNDGDEGADYNELIGLHEEADLSVEELRKRYYGGANGESKKKTDLSTTKKKTLPQDDDDDGCGF